MTKLLAKGFEQELVVKVLSILKQENLLSDLRFAINLLRSRTVKGYGPLKIKQELYTAGVDEETLSAALIDLEIDWQQILVKTWQKKFKGIKPKTNGEMQKQIRFLLYRGFSMEEIRELNLSRNFA